MVVYKILILFIISFVHAQWQQITQPGIGTISIIIEDNNILFAATNQAQVFRSEDQANSWQMQADTLDTEPYGSDLLFFNKEALYFTQNIGTEPYNYICPSVFSDSETWQLQPYQSSALTSMIGNDSLVLTIINGIAVSTDTGQNWYNIPDPPFTGYINLNLITDDYLYVSHGCLLYRTQDLGQTWENITGNLDSEGFASPYSCSMVLAMASHGNKLIISMYWGGGLGKLFVSDDGGESWSLLDDFPVDHSVNAIVSKNGILYAGTASTISGLYYTGDLISWTDFSTGLESYDRSVSSLVASDEFLFKTGSTINSHRIPLPQLRTAVEVITSTGFSIYQNYPNPFNPVTFLSYELPQDEWVNIIVYDILGNKVKTLVNSSQTAGYKSVRWNATSDLEKPVSAGMYIYSIQAGKFRQTRKMILLK